MLSRRVALSVMAVLVCVGGIDVVAAAQDVSGGLLGDLPKLKDFTAARQSSYDPSGGNADGRQDWPLQPGETRQMAKVDGPGAITHIWITIASSDPQHLKDLVLRMYWDGEEQPSVETPIGDFFGQGHSKYYHYSCLPIQIGTNNGLNCFWRMPFEKGARITVTNDGPVKVDAFYYYVDYQQYKAAPADQGRFHAQYRQAYPCPAEQNYVFFETQGRGHYVGCNLSIHNRADGWWGEGDDMIYIDGETQPTFNGTGSEDYFGGAWCYGPVFSDLFLGCPLRGEHKKDALWNVYRYHLNDPIPFTKSIKMTIEHGHANDRSDDFSSVAYWYQTEPHAAFPPLPKAGERLPKELQTPGPIDGEAEDMAAAFQNPEVTAQAMDGFGKEWSNAKQLWFRPQGPATYSVTLPPASAGEAGAYKLQIWYTAAPAYGKCELWLNGKQVGDWDGYHAEGVARKGAAFPITIKEGANQLEVRITGKASGSSGFQAGIDCYRLSPKQ